MADGSPYPDITWWNNNRIVTPNARVSVSNTGQHLRIQNIEVYDEGMDNNNMSLTTTNQSQAKKETYCLWLLR